MWLSRSFFQRILLVVVVILLLLLFLFHGLLSSQVVFGCCLFMLLVSHVGVFFWGLCISIRGFSCVTTGDAG